MSTEHQQYSTENQRKVIRQYAESRGMEIVRTYTDAGKSGSAYMRRSAARNLISASVRGIADATTDAAI
jgi:DNA invertase Pin-like site-specific DNA recombinase